MPKSILQDSGQNIIGKMSQILTVRCESLATCFAAGDDSQALATYEWSSNFNGTSGGVATSANSLPADPGSGTGGVTITSINGVPQTPPTSTCSATPNILWPPNCMASRVMVSGTISAGTSKLVSTTYSVSDSEVVVQPSGAITLAADGSYSFTIPLIAARNGTDIKGRTYNVFVTGTDGIGNVGICSAVITVPHDQGN